MIRSPSIFFRILSLNVAAIVAVAILMPLALYWLLTSAAANLQRRSLSDNAAAIARYLSVDELGKWRLDLPLDLRQLYSTSYGRYAFAIVDSAGAVLFSSLPQQTAVLTDDAHQATPVYKVDGPEADLTYRASIPLTVAGQRIWVQIQQDPEHRDVLIDDIVQTFFSRIGWITLPIMALLVLVDIVIVRSALRPLIRASMEAEMIAPARSELRLPTMDMPVEIRPLIHAINLALDRLAAGYKSQQEFAANAAHELRTPLTILRTRIGSLGESDVVQSLRQSVERMSRTVAQLLDMAETERFAINDDETTDLVRVAEEVAEMMAPIAIGNGREVSLSAPEHPVDVTGNHEMLVCAVRNLAENALNHAPPDTTVEIEVTSARRVRVLDRGPGVPIENRDRIFERFQRGRLDGAGLGLAIVRQVAGAHGAVVAIDGRADGGAVFEIQFPDRSSKEA